jgi:hypothetical protein
MSILSKIDGGLGRLLDIFKSQKARAAFQEAAELAVIAVPIVQQINAIVPSGTVTQALAAFQHFGATPVQEIADNSTSVGNALLNLATQLLKEKLPPAKAATATSLLNTAVQLAVIGSKAGA